MKGKLTTLGVRLRMRRWGKALMVGWKITIATINR